MKFQTNDNCNYTIDDKDVLFLENKDVTSIKCSYKLFKESFFIGQSKSVFDTQQSTI